MLGILDSRCDCQVYDFKVILTNIVIYFFSVKAGVPIYIVITLMIGSYIFFVNDKNTFVSKLARILLC